MNANQRVPTLLHDHDNVINQIEKNNKNSINSLGLQRLLLNLGLVHQLDLFVVGCQQLLERKANNVNSQEFQEPTNM